MNPQRRKKEKKKKKKMGKEVTNSGIVASK